MKKILMLNSLNSTFIKKDFQMLNEDNVVYQVEPKIKNIFKMFRFVKKSDIIYAWWLNSRYAGWLGRLANKPVVYVAGGFDTVINKDIGYGVFQNPIYRLLTKFNVKSAEKILVVSKNLKFNLIRNIDGINENKIKVIPTGYDINFWKDLNKARKYKNVCVAYNQNTDEKKFKIRCLVKGIDRYLELINSKKEKSVLIGVNQDILVKLYPEAKDLILNKVLYVLPVLDREQLLEVYNLSENYCLLSRHEGLPNSLVEAMLCGCKPELHFDMNYLKDVNPKELTLDKRKKDIQKVLEEIKPKDTKNKDINTFMNRK